MRLTSMLATAMLVASTMIVVTAGAASADVTRYQLETATFTATQPAGQVGQWVSVWTHNFVVTVNPCDDTFSGTAKQFYPNGTFYADETVTGTLGASSISMTVVRTVDPVTWTLTNALYDPFINLATTDPAVNFPVEFKVTHPVITGTSSYKNHGQYVKEQGGGDDAAHSCIGMPITNTVYQWSQNGTVDSSSMAGTDVALPMAGTYRIDVIGDWQGAGAADTMDLVDAEYLTSDAWATVRSPNIDQGDLQINGQFVDWGAYSPYHAYTLAMSLSGTVNLGVFDGDWTTNTKNSAWYTDNVGSLYFTITYVGP